EEDLKFVEDLFNSYICNKKHIAEMISAKLIGFSSERTYIVDMALLNLAIAEICFLKLTDVKIVINETIELAKKFSTDKSPKFINGILGAIVKEQ
ncbi:MAG: transcription antitermination protein NusB, partial [Clostridia bacterium]